MKSIISTKLFVFALLACSATRAMDMSKGEKELAAAAPFYTQCKQLCYDTVLNGPGQYKSTSDTIFTAFAQCRTQCQILAFKQILKQKKPTSN